MHQHDVMTKVAQILGWLSLDAETSLSGYSVIKKKKGRASYSSLNFLGLVCFCNLKLTDNTISSYF